MGPIDWVVLTLYLTAMVAVSAWLSRRQRSLADYYLGGRKLSAGAVGISTLATQSSAISFLSIPAFVALREEGGLRFLQYELALPAAMAALALWVMPALRRAGVVTIYEYLALRFDARVRRAIALVFLISRGLATGVALYATGLILHTCLGLPLWLNLLLVGLVTVLYDLLGGMEAVVYSDVVQMGVLLVALGTAIWTVTTAVGGPTAVIEHFPAARLAALAQPAQGPDGLAAYILGGMFLYMSYYGCDQSQAQRLLSVGSVRSSQWALMLNGTARFPLICGYCLLGVVASAALAVHPDLQAAVHEGPSDSLVPQLIRTFLPTGVRGLVFAGLLAAAMSSLDSALNALSASTVRDFWRTTASSDRAEVRRARLATLAWGLAITGFAFIVGDISKTVIEAINKIGSLFYGPVLAVFLLALPARRCTADAVLVGLASGVALNLILYLTAPELHFLWWNVSGCLTTLLMACGLQPFWSRQGPGASQPPNPSRSRPRAFGPPSPPPPDALPNAWIAGWSLAATAWILAVMWLLQYLAQVHR